MIRFVSRLAAYVIDHVRAVGLTNGRAKNSARSGHRLLMTAIRAGFEPFRALGSPIASRTKTMLSERSGVLGKAEPHTTAQNRRGLVRVLFELPGGPSFSPYPSADQLISVQNPLPDWVG